MTSPAIRVASRLKELRIHLCQTNQASKGVREFITNQYVPMKQANPEFPILIREKSGVVPRVWARYEFGRETNVNLENMSAAQVKATIEQLNQS